MRWIAATACAFVLAGCGAAKQTHEVPSNASAEEPAELVAETAGTEAKLPPLPDESRPRVVEPSAGVTHEEVVEEEEAEEDLVAADRGDTPKPTGPASSTNRRSGIPAAIDGSVRKATALPNGIALPPLEAPTAVLKVIEAGNVIARTPYKWGGGHGRFLDDGYDCSGSVSFALYAAGLISGPRTSGGLMSWGKAGRGKWITIYTNPGHVYMEVAGIRFDTSGARQTGSRWQNQLRSHSGYVARHPPGL
jgi:cell wall-associated NlpC family hydrolase